MTRHIIDHRIDPTTKPVNATEWTGEPPRWTGDELSDAWDALEKDPRGWKYPIPPQFVAVPKLSVTAAAIAHYAGSPTWFLPTIETMGDGTTALVITAPGYYHCIGA